MKKKRGPSENAITKNTITKIYSAVDALHCRMEGTGRRIRDLEERTIKVIQCQQQREDSLTKKDRASGCGAKTKGLR